MALLNSTNSPPICRILVGPPGSGKSSFASRLLSTYVNQDTQGREGHLDIFLGAIERGEDVVIDRMNFSVEQRARYIDWARAAGYSIYIDVMYVPYEICQQRCVARKDHPTIRNAEDATAALNHFFRKWEKPTIEEADQVANHYLDFTNKSPAIIVDLDGTLCNIDHRLHHVQGEGKKDWDSFFAGIPGDSVNEWCRDLVQGMTNECRIVLCSGRGAEYRTSTENWLASHYVDWDQLYMRPAGDYRRDDVVKEMLLDFEILPRYLVLFAVDDRDQVCAMWRRRGITTLQCTDKGNF